MLPEPRPQGCLPAAAAPSTRDPGSRSRQPSRARARPVCVVRRAWSSVQSARLWRYSSTSSGTNWRIKYFLRENARTSGRQEEDKVRAPQAAWCARRLCCGGAALRLRGKGPGPAPSEAALGGRPAGVVPGRGWRFFLQKTRADGRLPARERLRGAAPRRAGPHTAAGGEALSSAPWRAAMGGSHHLARGNV